MYDEDDDDLKAQFNRIGEYRRTNPDLAVGSTAHHPDSWDQAMARKRQSAVEALREPEPGPSINEIEEEASHGTSQD